MFSLTPPSSIEIKYGQNFTQTVAELLFIAYHGMAIILLLNMLIAMMSNSFQDIEVRAHSPHVQSCFVLSWLVYVLVLTRV